MLSRSRRPEKNHPERCLGQGESTCSLDRFSTALGTDLEVSEAVKRCLDFYRNRLNHEVLGRTTESPMGSHVPKISQVFLDAKNSLHNTII